MKRILQVLAVLGTLITGALAAGPSGQPAITQIQNGGTTIGTFVNYLKLNCSTGTTCTLANGVVSITAAGAGGTISGAGNLSPLFTTTVTGGNTISFTAANSAANTIFGRAAGTSGPASFFALTGDCTISNGILTCSQLNGGAFSGANGNLVSFGAANVPADSGVVAANVATASGTLNVNAVLLGNGTKTLKISSQCTDNGSLFACNSFSASGAGAALDQVGIADPGAPANGTGRLYFNSSYLRWMDYSFNPAAGPTALAHWGCTSTGCFNYASSTQVNGLNKEASLAGNTTTPAYLCEDASGNPSWCQLSAVNGQTGTYQVVVGDFSSFKTITVASGTFTITLVASGSQPANGQYINIINYGTGVVTVARSGQNINGGTASLTIPASTATATNGAFIISDGTNYFADVNGADAANFPTSASLLGTNSSAAPVAATAHSVSAVATCKPVSASSTAYTCTTTPTFVPADGDMVLFEPDVALGAAATLNVNSSSAAALVDNLSTALVANDILAGQHQILVFDGANWQMIGQPAGKFTLNGATSGSGTITPNGTSTQIASSQTWAAPNFTVNSTGGHIKTNAGTNDITGTIAISSNTSATKTFTTNYTSAPSCVITPITDPTTVGVWWVTTTTSTVVANVKVSGSITFNYVCVANPT